MSQLLEQFKRTRNPYGRRLGSVENMQLGYALTNGMCFPYIAGGVILRRRRLYPTVGPWSFCGFARPNETTITSSLGFGHETNMAYEYAAAQVLGNGYAGEFSEPARLDFDGSGNLITGRLPNAPLHVVAEPIAAGKYALSWEYDAYGQGTVPVDFQVFEGADAGSVNYAAPLTDSVTGLNTVLVIGSRRRYEFTTGAFSDGSSHVFAVRARNATPTAEKNTFTSRPKTARSTAASLTALVSGVMRRA
jgi:hypothetical protein